MKQGTQVRLLVDGRPAIGVVTEPYETFAWVRVNGLSYEYAVNYEDLEVISWKSSQEVSGEPDPQSLSAG